MTSIENLQESKKQRINPERDTFNDELLKKGTFKVKAIVDDSYTTIEPILGNKN